MGHPRNDGGGSYYYCTASPSPNSNYYTSRTLLIVLMMAIMMMMMMSVLAQSDQEIIINEFCKTMRNPMICTVMVKGATKWEEAVTNALESTVQLNRDEIQKMLPEVLHSFDNLSEMSKDSANKTCQSEFSNIDYNLKEAMRFWSQKDIRSLNLYLTPCRFVFCQQVTDFNVTLPPQFYNVEDKLYWHIDTCVSLLSVNHT